MESGGGTSWEGLTGFGIVWLGGCCWFGAAGCWMGEICKSADT